MVRAPRAARVLSGGSQAAGSRISSGPSKQSSHRGRDRVRPGARVASLPLGQIHQFLYPLGGRRPLPDIISEWLTIARFRSGPIRSGLGR